MPGPIPIQDVVQYTGKETAVYLPETGFTQLGALERARRDASKQADLARKEREKARFAKLTEIDVKELEFKNNSDQVNLINGFYDEAIDKYKKDMQLQGEISDETALKITHDAKVLEAKLLEMSANQTRFDEAITEYTENPDKYDPASESALKEYEETGNFYGLISADADVMKYVNDNFGDIFSDVVKAQEANLAAGGVLTTEQISTFNLQGKADNVYDMLNPYHRNSLERKYQYISEDRKKQLEVQYGSAIEDSRDYFSALIDDMYRKEYERQSLQQQRNISVAYQGTKPFKGRVSYTGEYLKGTSPAPEGFPTDESKEMYVWDHIDVQQAGTMNLDPGLAELFNIDPKDKGNRLLSGIFGANAYEFMEVTLAPGDNRVVAKEDFKYKDVTFRKGSSIPNTVVGWAIENNKEDLLGQAFQWNVIANVKPTAQIVNYRFEAIGTNKMKIGEEDGVDVTEDVKFDREGNPYVIFNGEQVGLRKEGNQYIITNVEKVLSGVRKTALVTKSNTTADATIQSFLDDVNPDVAASYRGIPGDIQGFDRDAWIQGTGYAPGVPRERGRPGGWTGKWRGGAGAGGNVKTLEDL